MKKVPRIDDPEDLAFFVALCERYRDVMYRTARSILTGGYRRHVDDAVQNAMIALAKNIKMIKTKIACSKRQGFIVRVVKNKAIDTIRHERLRPCSDLDSVAFMAASDEDDPSDAVIRAENYAELIDAIKALDDNYRTILGFKIIDGLSDQEIALLLQITPKNVNVRVFRAKRKLREILQRER